MKLDPQAQAVIDKAVASGLPRPTSLEPVQARLAYRTIRKPTQPPAREMALVRDLDVASPAGRLSLREYRPLGTDAHAVLPALVYFHGGGWVIGDLETHDVLCRDLSDLSGAAVFAVDYRLAPEHRFGAAVDDALAATSYLAAHAQDLAVDASRLVVGGDSAGGNLAAVVALSLRASAVKLAGQLLIYPVTDQRANTESYQTMGSGYTLTAADMAWFRNHYLDEADYADWRASPLLAKDFKGLPPALVLTAGYDPLHDEGRLYADALAAAGNRVSYIDFSRQLHGFIGMGAVIDEASVAVRLCADWLRQHVAI